MEFATGKPQILVFTRPENDGGTTAIISLTPLISPDFNPDLFARLIRGVTRWVATTASGREAWDYSSEDLNIGDLAECEGEPELVAALQSAGISEFKVIEMFDNNDCYPFDTLLVDPAVVAPDPQ
jgi:hypothetical protein